MKRSKFSETRIVAVLKEAEAGGPVKEVCRTYGISHATYYNWKAVQTVCLTGTLTPDSRHSMSCYYASNSGKPVVSYNTVGKLVRRYQKFI